MDKSKVMQYLRMNARGNAVLTIVSRLYSRFGYIAGDGLITQEATTPEKISKVMDTAKEVNVVVDEDTRVIQVELVYPTAEHIITFHFVPREEYQELVDTFGDNTEKIAEKIEQYYPAMTA